MKSETLLEPRALIVPKENPQKKVFFSSFSFGWGLPPLKKTLFWGVLGCAGISPKGGCFWVILFSSSFLISDHDTFFRFRFAYRVPRG